MALFKKEEKRVSAFDFAQKPFFAAYSSVPFLENSQSRPDYAFYEVGGTYYCVRIGEMEIPWGFSQQECPFWANGVVRIVRPNTIADLNGMGYRYVKEANGVYYLYETIFDNHGLWGITITLRDKLLPIFRQIAQKSDMEGFKDELKNDEVRKRIEEVLKGEFRLAKNCPIRLDGVGCESKDEKNQED